MFEGESPDPISIQIAPIPPLLKDEKRGDCDEYFRKLIQNFRYFLHDGIESSW
jgi:hypothetical protein